MPWLGIDVGGTFTDLVFYDEDSGWLALQKVPSTPDDHARGVIAGIDRLDIDLNRVTRLTHGTTVATNAVLERDGARLAVLTTKGFRDVLVVGRGNRTVLYDIKAVRPPPLLPRAMIKEVEERTLADGTVLRAVDQGAVENIAETLKAEGVEAVAVCYLHAYANDTNERATKAVLERVLPEVRVSTSSEVLPEYREYERFATTALNAYVAPRVGSYLSSLSERLAEHGYRNPIAIMTSNGGTAPVDRVITYPVTSMLSGPAAGVIGAVYVARAAGHNDIITFDMGGTSTDVCLIRGGELSMTTEGMIGTIPNKVPQIEINSIGAGGGSIASLGPGRFLDVGPESAGAAPGPACYGRGGTKATVTDANVVLGRLNPDQALGGEIRLDAEAARVAVAGIGARLDLDEMRMAEGIVQLAVTRMTGAIKEVSIMRGNDPRDFVLYAYGGAGPLHAAMIAEELGMPSVVVPPMPGNFSAFGLLVADVRHDYARTRLTACADLTVEQLGAVIDEMRAEAYTELAAEGFAEDAMRFEARFDMRYIGQAFELSVELPDNTGSMAEVEAAFRGLYERRYSHATDEPSEIVCFRLAAFGVGAKPRLPEISAAGGTFAHTREGARQVTFNGAFMETSVYNRLKLPPEATLEGPALVEEPGTTTVIPPAFRARADHHGNLILERG